MSTNEGRCAFPGCGQIYEAAVHRHNDFPCCEHCEHTQTLYIHRFVFSPAPPVEEPKTEQPRCAFTWGENVCDGFETDTPHDGMWPNFYGIPVHKFTPSSVAPSPVEEKREERETITDVAILKAGFVYSRSCPPSTHYSLTEHNRDLLKDSEQGFSTSRGRFVGRAEAMQIAIAAGQVKQEDTFNGVDLFSEDLIPGSRRVDRLQFDDAPTCGTFLDAPTEPRARLGEQQIAFGAGLRDLRKRHQLTMGDIADLLQCPVARLSALERGEEY